eukprot:COSAG03_NODE_429_length_7977_cov_3.949606_4_plen_68_part_00
MSANQCCELTVFLDGCRLAIAILKQLLGPDMAADRLASDTPLGHGTVYQAVAAPHNTYAIFVCRICM